MAIWLAFLEDRRHDSVVPIDSKSVNKLSTLRCSLLLVRNRIGGIVFLCFLHSIGG